MALKVEYPPKKRRNSLSDRDEALHAVPVLSVRVQVNEFTQFELSRWEADRVRIVPVNARRRGTEKLSSGNRGEFGRSSVMLCLVRSVRASAWSETGHSPHPATSDSRDRGGSGSASVAERREVLP